MKVKNYIVSKASKIEGEALQLHNLGTFNSFEQAEYCVKNEIASEEAESGMPLDIDEKEYNDGRCVKLYHHYNEYHEYEFTIRIEEIEVDVDIERWGETLAYLSADMMPKLGEALKEEGFDSHVAVFKLMSYTDEIEAMVEKKLENGKCADYADILSEFMAKHQDELTEWCKD